MSTDAILNNDLRILEDESNPQSSNTIVLRPVTTIDQVRESNLSNRTLVDIINELRQAIKAGGETTIVFPVDSVNGMTGDVNITKDTIGLGNVENYSPKDMPMSDAQFEAIQEMLRNFHPTVDLHELYDHIANTSNPHNVTLDQIDVNNDIEGIVSRIVNEHNVSQTAHTYINRNINSLSNNIASIGNKVNALATSVDSVRLLVSKHNADEGAHLDLFSQKENVSNKISIINDTSTAEQYPSATAVKAFVNTSLDTFKSKLNLPDDWIKDVIVVENTASLPTPTKRCDHILYFVRQGDDGKALLARAVCLTIMPEEWAWLFTDLNCYVTYGNSFDTSGSELELDYKNVVNKFFSQPEAQSTMSAAMTEIMQQELNNYYTKSDISELGFINQISMETGTMNGCIKYFINGDTSTMNEVRVSGLQKLAFMEEITGNDIALKTIWNDHIADASIDSRVIKPKNVDASKLTAPYETFFGNIGDPLDGTVEAIPLIDLARKLLPFLEKVTIDMDPISGDTISQIINEEYENA